MKSAVGTVIVYIVLVGCGPPPPVPKATHVTQVQQAVVKGGGETNILAESRTLFDRLSKETGDVQLAGADNQLFHGLTGITNLGDVFTYHRSWPDRMEVRVYNNHFDVFFIVVLNPDLPEPKGFERIAGNVGFLEPGVVNRY